jgi:hypothetical protein
VGRLGNHLFQIAALLAHCIEWGKTPVLVLPLPETSVAAYYAKDATLSRCAALVCSAPWTRAVVNKAEDAPFGFRPIAPDATVLCGYFQSARFFSDTHRASDVLAFFEPSRELARVVDEAYADLLTPAAVERTIVIHVRRGDYCTSSVHGILTPAFFKRGIGRVREELVKRGVARPRVLVFSDDLAFCAAAFTDSETHCETLCVDEAREAVALCLMARFRFYVMSNSSFSWWAVKLGEPAQVVVAPRPWFGPTGPPDFDDVYEPGWIQAPAC